MKKSIVSIIALILIFSVFVACASKTDNSKETTSEKTSVSEKVEVEGTTKIVKNLVTTQIAKEPIEKAEISGYDATQLISSKDAKVLGLKGSTKDYRFMLASEGKVIDNVNYIEVLAMINGEENKDGSLNITTVGDYFVSYDGKKILVRDLTTGEFSELK